MCEVGDIVHLTDADAHNMLELGVVERADVPLEKSMLGRVPMDPPRVPWTNPNTLPALSAGRPPARPGRR